MEGPLVVKFVTNLSPKNGTNPFRAKSQKNVRLITKNSNSTFYMYHKAIK